MKKFIVFMLVLGMTSLVNATIESPILLYYDDVNGWTLELPSGMSSAVDMSGGYWALISSSTLAPPFTPDPLNPITDGDLTSLAPDASGIFGDAGDSGLFPYGVGVYGFFGSYSVTWSSASGVYAHSFNGTPVSAALYLINDSFTTATFVMIAERIPEPATIALLGLGGLLLRRRK